MQPIVKWAGGKRQLLPEIRARIPEFSGRYFEPFLGGGAVWLDLAPERAAVSDINPGLIELLEVVRDDVEELIDELGGHRNDEKYFYEVRAWDRDAEIWSSKSKVQRAGRMLYLNKTCFNGLHRVNRAGQFNVPFGKYVRPNIVNESGLRELNAYLNATDVQLSVAGYQELCAAARPGDFVYLDPPYDVVSATSSFTSYARDEFGRAQQMELKATCDALTARGVDWLLSNSATEFIVDLYSEYTVDIVGATRAINSVATRRGKVSEVLVRP
ncbi:DNA adenine methylase [Corynebacterium ulceribovis]|uniref:DNA adenine methylase n=1 Tax=Corynebacterium ulceribovis TaxID=487732 RepID=UPI0003754486|nr:DNA adenine methylase [Corynebacterium ulceribovis]